MGLPAGRSGQTPYGYNNDIFLALSCCQLSELKDKNNVLFITYACQGSSVLKSIGMEHSNLFVSWFFNFYLFYFIFIFN